MLKRVVFMLFACMIVGLFTSCAESSEKVSFSDGTQTSVDEGVTVTEKVMLEPLPEKIELANTEKYIIFVENGNCYIQFDGAEADNNTDSNALQSAGYPEFASVKEMKAALLSGDLSESEMQALCMFADNRAEPVEICNLEKLYEGAFPVGTDVEYVQFFGSGYSFGIENGDVYGFLNYVDEDSYTEEYNTLFKGEGMSKSAEVISEEVSADGKASILEYRYGGNHYKKVRYSIPTEYGELYILQSSRITEEAGGTSESNRSIDFFGIIDGAHFYGWIKGFEEVPTEEWLASFGLREYVETEVS